MTGVESAIRSAGEGQVHVEVEVVPGAKETRVPSGFNPWRSRIQVRVQAPPQKGKANRDLEDAMAATLDVPRAAVRVIHGHRDRMKTVLIDGLDETTVRERLERGLADDAAG